jgi:hypothetical protein
MDENINAQDEIGATRLSWAASDDDVEEARRLLSRGADPNIPEVNGITPLMDAASGGNTEMVEVLLAGGADIHVLDKFGDCAADYARAQGFPGLADMLEGRADPALMDGARCEHELRMAEQERKVAEIVNRLPETREIDVWCISSGGEPLGIADSEDRARAMFEADGDAPLTFDVKRETVGVVEGVLRNWGTDDDPRPHVSWVCPACGETHDTDLEPDESTPALWYCAEGVGKAKFLVRWRQEEGG